MIALDHVLMGRLPVSLIGQPAGQTFYIMGTETMNHEQVIAELCENTDPVELIDETVKMLRDLIVSVKSTIGRLSAMKKILSTMMVAETLKTNEHCTLYRLKNGRFILRYVNGSEYEYTTEQQARLAFHRADRFESRCLKNTAGRLGCRCLFSFNPIGAMS